jgi:lysozyme family protein
MSRFAECLPLILRYEGGYVNDPDDRGGATNQGVTQRVYDAWRDSVGRPPQTVRLIMSDEVGAIYERDYWTVAGCPSLPVPLDLAVFDAAVNSGPKRSIVWLQRALGVADDGVLGPKTLAAVAAQDARVLAGKAIDQRERSLHTFATKPGQAKFLKGWLKRTADLRKRCA